MSFSYIGLICARGGSKGVPGKNIRTMAGSPLIAWSIGHLQAIERVERVIVSTDSFEIADIARHYGAEVPFMRPAELAGDTSSEWLVWRHALDHLRNTDGQIPNGLVVAPATAPLRHSDDIERCLDLYESERPDAVITVSPAHRNPYFNMTCVDEQGRSRLAFTPEQPFHRRQDCPPFYDMTTVAYVVRPDYVHSAANLFSGHVRQVEIPLERAIDIDTLHDFRIAEFLLSERMGTP